MFIMTALGYVALQCEAIAAPTSLGVEDLGARWSLMAMGEDVGNISLPSPKGWQGAYSSHDLAIVQRRQTPLFMSRARAIAGKR